MSGCSHAGMDDKARARLHRWREELNASSPIILVPLRTEPDQKLMLIVLICPVVFLKVLLERGGGESEVT